MSDFEDSDEDFLANDDSPLDVYKKQLEKRKARRKENTQWLDFPSERSIKNLDTNIKKNSTFVKGKLAALKANQKSSLEAEFAKLNLMRYKAEAITTLTTSKYKDVDLDVAVFICELFFRRFEDFQDLLVDAWKGLFTKYKQVFVEHKKLEKKKGNEEYKNKIPENLDVTKLKQDLKFLSELTALGIIPDKSGLGMLNFMMKELTVENEGKQTEFLEIILHLCKTIGDDIFGLTPRDRKSDLILSDLLEAEKQKIFQDILTKYYTWLNKLIKDKHKEWARQEKKNLKVLTEVKGELSDKRKELTQGLKEDYESWLAKLTELANYMNLDPPVFQDVEKAEESTVGIEFVIEQVKNRGDLGVWEDEDQKAFYTSLRGLKEIIPGNLWQQSSNQHRDPNARRDGKKSKVTGFGFWVKVKTFF